MDYIISFIGQKGGVGKSTLARAVAREFQANGFNIKVADMDIQQTTTVNWHNRRLNAGFDSVGSVEAFASFEEAKSSAQHYDALVVDAAGRASAASAEIAQVSDLVIQPSAPSIDDLQPAVLLFHELVEKGIPRDRLRIALTFVGTPSEEKLAREYIDYAGYKTLDGALEFRPSYRSALNAGRTIAETTHKSLNARADTLLQAIFSEIQGVDVDEQQTEDLIELA